MNESANAFEEELPEGFGVATGQAESAYDTLRLKKENDEIQFLPLLLWGKMLDKDHNWRKEPGLYRALHFAFAGVDPRDPTKTRARPFLCIQEKKNKQITVSCAVCDGSELATKELAKREAWIDSKNAQTPGSVSPEQKFALLKATDDQARRFRKNGKFVIPVIQRNGRYALLEMPYNAYQKFIVARDERKNDDDASGANKTGRLSYWYRLTRNGKASLTSDNVTVCQMPVQVGEKTYKEPESHIFTNAELIGAMKALPDVVDNKESYRVSSDKLVQLMALATRQDGSADPLEVDKILGPRRGAQENAPAAVSAAANLAAELEAEMKLGHAAPSTASAPELTKAAIVTEQAPPAAQTIAAPAVLVNTTPAPVSTSPADAMAEFDKMFGPSTQAATA